MDTRSKTLSTQSAEVLRHFNALDQPSFTIQEAFTFLSNSSRDAVKKLMRDMIKRGLLMRLKDGVYWIIPYERNVSDFSPNWHLVAKYLVADADYYIGYYSALEIHSLITQPALQEQIVVNRQIKPSVLQIKDVRFQFIYHNKEHFFGEKDIWIDSFHKVKCSDLEKTFVDCLYKPDYAGGITEITKALYKSRDKLDYEKLFEYCKRFKVQVVIKRLGFLMELLGINQAILEELQRLKTNSYTVLEPAYEKKGKKISRWSIQQNMEIEEVTSSIFN